MFIYLIRRVIKLNLDIKIWSILLLLVLISQGNIFGNTNKKIKVKLKNKAQSDTEIKTNSVLNIKEITKDQSEKIDITSLYSAEITNLVISTNSALSVIPSQNNDETNSLFISKLSSFFKESIVNPLEYISFTSLYGERNHPVLKKKKNHKGIDLKASIGTNVFAFTDGIVKYAGKMNGYGNIVIISHKDGYETRYAHLNKINIKNNQKVKSGEKIASSGKSGLVSGPNLHFEIRKEGIPLNPLDYIKL